MKMRIENSRAPQRGLRRLPGSLTKRILSNLEDVLHTMLELLLRLGALAISSASSVWNRLDLSSLGCACGASLSPDLFNLLRWRSDPTGALPWLDADDVHGVDLFERSALAFHDEEVDQEHGDQIAACEDVAVQEINVTGDEWREECDEEVPEPIRGCGQSHAFRSVSRWI